jgi:hypothetical protein
MTGFSGSDGDMPNFPWSSSAGGDDTALAGLLSGPDTPPDLPAGLQPAADVIAALRARPSVDELATESTARAEFRKLVGVSPRRSRPLRRPRLIPSLLSAKAAVAAAAAVIAIGGVATAAYAGALPGPAQRLAHDVIGAPGVHAAGSQKTGKDGNLLARHHRRHRHRFYCSPAPKPSSTASPAASPTATPSWSPTPRPTPTGAPSPRPRPTCSPAPHPSHAPRPRPSCTPAPTPTPTSTPSAAASMWQHHWCGPKPHPTGTPAPRPSHPRRHRHHHHHYRGGHPGPSPTVQPTRAPAPRPSPSA